MKQFQRLFSALALMALPFMAVGQQETQFANTAGNPYLFNPAAGGMSDVVQIELGYRNQWVSVEGSPRTMYASVHAPISFRAGRRSLSEFNTAGKQLYAAPERTAGQLKHVLGGKVLSDNIGPFHKSSIFGSYAIHLPFTSRLNVGIGLAAGWGNFQIDPNQVVLHDNNDMTYDQFNGSVSGQHILDVQSGLVFYSQKFYLGISGTQLVKNAITVNQLESGNTLNRHLFIQAMYRIQLSNPLDVEPFVLVKAAEHSPTSYDFGARFRYQKALWLGLQYRTGNSYIFSAGINFLRNFQFSYAYEHNANAVRLSTGGTHEVQLGIILGRNRNIGKELREKDPELDIE
jgi:type IX secretion system PorP/SprF family membrane protein